MDNDPLDQFPVPAGDESDINSDEEYRGKVKEVHVFDHNRIVLRA